MVTSIRYTSEKSHIMNFPNPIDIVLRIGQENTFPNAKEVYMHK